MSKTTGKTTGKSTDETTDETTDEPDEERFPWQDADAARKNTRLQRRHDVSEAHEHYLSAARSCPRCAAAPGELTWFYFESPKWTWENLCGRAGWMTVCDPCRVQVDFFMEVLN